jgi:D-alanine-D-alanine ligase
MGGYSAERDISLKSGTAVLEALQRKGVDAHAVDVDRNFMKKFQPDLYDRAFIMLHGRGGEDGIMQAVLEMYGLPYTGSGVAGSAIAMDKARCKQLWKGAGVPTPPFVMLQEDMDPQKVAAEVGLPLIVKPVHEGSSIGMTKVTSPAQLKDAWQTAVKLDDEVMAEQWIEGDEYTVAVLGGEALPAIRLQTPREFYDFKAKYQADDTQYICPCGLPADKEAELQLLALQAFDAAAARGWGRVDVMMDGDQQPWLIEVNTVPGMTDHSLVPMAAKVANIAFDDLVLKILATSVN